MAAPRPVLILGAAGTFGSLAARELLQTTTAPLLLTGRRQRRLIDVAEQLDAGERVQTCELDFTSLDAVRDAARSCAAVLCTAGPFHLLPQALPRTCIAAGAHWIDIADTPTWIGQLLDDPELAAAAQARRLLVAPGMSSTPAISTALARACITALRTPLTQVRVTLFVGNRNLKGAAVISSALHGAAPTDPADVELLRFGHRRAYLCASADARLLSLSRAAPVEFRVAPESRLGGHVLALAAHLAHRYPSRAATLTALLAAASRPLGHYGTTLGSLDVHVTGATADTVHMAAIGPQRMAVIPATQLLRRVLDGHAPTGVHPPHTALPDADLLHTLRARDVEVAGPVYTTKRR